ncbi:hypothetical protein [Streptococcus suis]
MLFNINPFENNMLIRNYVYLKSVYSTN